MSREDAIRDFLAAAGWGGADRAALAGDASARRYERLTQSGASAVLMDAPPGSGTGVDRFARIARHLAGLGLSTPAILAEDTTHGLLLLEDFGDALLARLPAPEPEMYVAAAGVLAALHRHPPPDWLHPYDMALLTERAGFAIDWYAPPAAAGNRQDFVAALRTALAGLPDPESVVTLRDFHAENLIWLPDRDGPRRIGLLDFQDAEAGHPAYDLVSLLSDARRDVDATAARLARDHYLAATGRDPEAFGEAAAVLGAQRNLRILGVFARLCLRDGKRGYVDLIPRVWRNLAKDLSHPALSQLRAAVLRLLPEPDPAFLNSLKARCATIPAA